MKRKDSKIKTISSDYKIFFSSGKQKYDHTGEGKLEFLLRNWFDAFYPSWPCAYMNCQKWQFDTARAIQTIVFNICNWGASKCPKYNHSQMHVKAVFCRILLSSSLLNINLTKELIQKFPENNYFYIHKGTFINVYKLLCKNDGSGQHDSIAGKPTTARLIGHAGTSLRLGCFSSNPPSCGWPGKSK